jgi:hypothetical protein
LPDDFASRNVIPPPEGIRPRTKQGEQWHAKQIERFKERQRRVREWISFAEIAEWRSKEDSSIVPNEEKSAAAYEMLASDLLAGEFEEKGRSLVLYLHRAVTKYRMTTAWLQDAIAHNYDGDHGRSGYLAHCWLPRRLFDHWIAKHGLPASPPRFEPAGLATSPELCPSGGQPPSKAPYPAVAPAQRRGPRRVKREKVKEAMRAALRDGRLTVAALRDTREKNLETDYRVSRDTARKARNEVLSEPEFVGDSIRDY